MASNINIRDSQNNHRFHNLVISWLVGMWRIDRSSAKNGGGTASSATITLRQPLFLIVFGSLMLWYLARPSAYSAMSVVAVGGILGVSYWWTRQLGQGLSAARSLRYSAVQVGDEIEELVKLSNQSALPVIWAELSDHSNIPGYTLTSVRAVDGRRTIEWRAHAICERRGNYRFGPWEILTGDPFGLFQVIISYEQHEEILVYPPLADLPEHIVPRSLVQGEDRLLHQPLHAESLSAFTSRPFLPGDSMRHIHWGSTARHQNHYVKVFDPEGSSTLWLVPDLDQGVQKGSGQDSTIETMVILLASLADRLLRERLSVGLIAFTDGPRVILPARGSGHLWRILQILAGLESGWRPFSDTLSHVRTIVSGRHQVLAVTPSLHPAWALELQHLNQSRWRSGAEVILLDPVSFSSSITTFPAPSVDESQSPSEGYLPTAQAYLGLLTSMGIPTHVLRQGDVRPRLGSYGAVNRWDFLSLGTGRAFARHVPKKFSSTHASLNWQSGKE